jgi:hypothetical protein
MWPSLQLDILCSCCSLAMFSSPRGHFPRLCSPHDGFSTGFSEEKNEHAITVFKRIFRFIFLFQETM